MTTSRADATPTWWVTTPDAAEPVGPVSSALIVEGILAGRVPKYALICDDGRTRWRWLGEITEFLEALEEVTERRRNESDSDLSASDREFGTLSAR